jgi:hypothetical protein
VSRAASNHGITVELVLTVRVMWIAVVLAGVVVGCGRAGSEPSEDAPELAVHRHIAAAKAGDVAALRAGACGALAAAMARHSDDEVRREFIDAYDVGPDRVAARPAGSDDPARRQTVTGYYHGVADLEIAFVVENHDGWKVCEIRRGNGIFGPLPGPFEQ